MSKIPRKLSITSIDLNEINFTVVPNIPVIKKDDIYILLNEIPFRQFHIFYEISDGRKIYSIVPYKPFKYTDTLYIQILNNCFESYRYKIDFSLTLYKGFAKTNFIIPGKSKGKYYIKLDKLNGIPLNIKSNSFVVSQPINQCCSSLYSSKRTYAPGEIIELLLYLMTIDGTPVPDGYYEIEILQSDD